MKMTIVELSCEGGKVFETIYNDLISKNKDLKVKFSSQIYEKCKIHNQRMLDGENVNVCHSALATIST